MNDCLDKVCNVSKINGVDAIGLSFGTNGTQACSNIGETMDSIQKIYFFCRVSWVFIVLTPLILTKLQNLLPSTSTTWFVIFFVLVFMKAWIILAWIGCLQWISTTSPSLFDFIYPWTELGFALFVFEMVLTTIRIF